MAATAKKMSKVVRRPAKTRSIAKEEMAAQDNVLGHNERRCIVTKKSLPKSQLIRFVMAPNGWIVPDIRNKLPGRGVWITAERVLLQEAIKRNLFTRAFDHAVVVSPDLSQSVVNQLQLWIADLLGLAKKAGEAVAGFEKTEAALRQGKVGLLIEAKDAAENGKQKLHKLVKSGTNILTPLDAGALGRALGREQAVHVAIVRGRLAEKLAVACRKLMAMEN